MTVMKQTLAIIMHNAVTNISNNIDSITQTNDVDPLAGTESHDQSNVFTITQNLVATNDCDETGLGDNNAICSITAK